MNMFIVTIKVEKNPNHNPRAKVTAVCPVSSTCTDSTGEHHSVLMEAESAEDARERVFKSAGVHVTRVERASTLVAGGGVEEGWRPARCDPAMSYHSSPHKGCILR